MRRLAIFALLACGAFPSAHAACNHEAYDVSGHVSAREGGPVSGATVSVKWSGATEHESGFKSVRSGRDGSFAVAISVCEGKLTTATIDVSAPGRTAKRARAAFVQRKAVVDVVLE